jgi:putative membrane protein
MQFWLRTIVPMVSIWAAPVVLWAQERPYYDGGWGMHPMMWGAWGYGMMFMMLIFWALVIAAVVLGIRWISAQGKEPRSDSAIEILKQRYARGEIDKEEFDSRKKDLL